MFFKKKKETPKESFNIHNLKTVNILVDTFDLIKKIAYVFELGIQLVYIAYLIIKIIFKSGFFIGNLILLILSCIYLGYHIVATNITLENKQDQLKHKRNIKTVKRVFRILKRIINASIIGYAIYELIVLKSPSMVDLLFLVFMIIGFIGSIVCDIIIYIIDARLQLLKDAIAVDVVDFKENHKFLGKALDKFSYTRDMEASDEQREKVEKTREKVKKRHPHLFKKNKKEDKENEVLEIK